MNRLTDPAPGPDRNTLAASLAAIVGPEGVRSDAASCIAATADIFPFPPPAPAELVVRPRSTAETAAVVRCLAQARRAIAPRGAGLSYTGGPSPAASAVVIDTRALDAIRIDAANAVAVVGAGCTWQKLFEACLAHGLRPAQTSPISGALTTVGATAAQSIPGGTAGILGVVAVLADGTTVRTGAALGEIAFLRDAGPDLTGLFLGDCGAFAIKTAIVLRLSPDRPCAFASFAYDDAGALLDDVVTLARRGLVTRALALDPQKTSDAAHVEAGDAAKVLGATVAGARSLGAAVKDVVQLARGQRDLKHAGWTLHLTVEGADESIATAQLALARALCAPHAREIEPVVPKALRLKPYSVRGLVGMAGERWVPVHGILPLAQARACFAAIEALLAREAAALAAEAIGTSTLVSSLGPYVTIEPMFFWRDALDPLQLDALSERNRARFAGRAANPAARATVARLRVALRDEMDRFGAVHTQVGRFYHYAGAMDAGSAALVVRIKQALDPQGRMNPGVLGL